ncbi:MAG: SGNH/GDSL hydrolase family protein [Armatimonadetes bacterium]|nr:SGNH/GDSL hydrolase family protein [Armatimonadota bacterium]
MHSGARVFAAILVLAIVIAVPASAEQFIKPNDRVVFLGDSITAQRLYTKYVEDYFTTSHPEMNVTFVNAGVGGDRSSAALNRVEKDVIAAKPTVITICFGGNDAAYRPTVDMKGLQTFKDGLSNLISHIRARTDARVVLLTTTCVDETRNSKLKGYNLTLSRFIAETKKVAAKEGVPVIDLFHPLRAALAVGQRTDPSFTLIPDGVHPNEAGHRVMADTILRAWGEAPK